MSGAQPAQGVRPGIDMTKLGLPRTLDREFHDFCTGIIASYDGLRSIAVYGSLARGEYVPGRSDVNVLLVVDYADLGTLRKAIRVVRKGRERCHLTPVFLTKDDITTSTDAFPMRFHDMKEAYVVVYGEDILGQLEVSDENLRLQVEQELKTLLFAVREFFLQHGHASGPAGADILLGYFSKFLYLLKHLLRLHGVAAPAKTDELIAAASAQWGFDQRALLHLLEYKRGRAMADAVAEAVNFYEALARAATVADRLEVTRRG